MTTSASTLQGRTAWRWAIGIGVIVLLSLLYLLQITVARGYQGERQSLELFLRSVFEWTAWAVLLPGILWFADAVPVGPGRPRRNLVLQIAGGALVMPVWSLLVAIPISGLGLSLWGQRPPANILDTAEAALFQRGPFISIIYGLIVGLATGRRLIEEREAAATRTIELQRELAESDLAQFTQLMESERLVDRLLEVEAVALESPEAAEVKTLALAQELHASLLRSRDILRSEMPATNSERE